jgi:pyruvate kinase
MEHSSRPTRAEASDVFNAVVDGTDAVMLSGESAVGEYPTLAVTTMRQICAEAEAFLKTTRPPRQAASASLSGLVQPITEAAVDAACLAAQRLDAPLIVIATESGRAALALSNRRPTAAVLALTRTEAVARLLALCWGVTALVAASGTASAEQDLAFAADWARARGLVQPGQHVVLLRGEMPGQFNSRAVLVHKVS